MPARFRNRASPIFLAAFAGEISENRIADVWKAWDKESPIRAGLPNSKWATVDISHETMENNLSEAMKSGRLSLHLPPKEDNTGFNGNWFGLRLEWGPALAKLPPASRSTKIDGEQFQFMGLVPENSVQANFDPQTDGDFLYRHARVLTDALNSPFGFGDDRLCLSLLPDLSDARSVAWGLNYYGLEMRKRLGVEKLAFDEIFERILDSPHVDEDERGGIWVSLGIDCFDPTVMQFAEKAELEQYLDLWTLYGSGKKPARAG